MIESLDFMSLRIALKTLNLYQSKTEFTMKIFLKNIGLKNANVIIFLFSINTIFNLIKNM